jgi:hypothetical protein
MAAIAPISISIDISHCAFHWLGGNSQRHSVPGRLTARDIMTAASEQTAETFDRSRKESSGTGSVCYIKDLFCALTGLEVKRWRFSGTSLASEFSRNSGSEGSIVDYQRDINAGECKKNTRIDMPLSLSPPSSGAVFLNALQVNGLWQ